MSESASSEHDRTEPATPFKLNEARKQGQVAKSLDFNSFMMMLAFLSMLMLVGPDGWQHMMGFIETLILSGSSAGDVGFIAQAVTATASTYWGLLLAPLCFGAIAAVLANIVQTGPIFSTDPIKPKFERLNPVAGFKRAFNKRVLFEVLKSILKLAILFAVSYATFSARWDELPTVSNKTPMEQLAWFADVCVTLLFRCVLALLVMALIDIGLVRWQFSKRMRMSRRDMKDEVKRREGDPLIRQKIRQLQRENLKQSKSLNRVQDADVLITNPTHLAVALRYVRGQMSAPSVIAKGSERWAQDMRALALKHGVPIFERKRLARSLFRRAVLDKPIPVETFVDVARLYSDLASLRNSRKARVEVSA